MLLSSAGYGLLEFSLHSFLSAGLQLGEVGARMLDDLAGPSYARLDG